MDFDTRTLSLCSRCLESCPDENLSRHDGQRLCPDCLEIAEIRDARRRAAASVIAPPTPVAPEGRWRRFFFAAGQWAEGRSALIRLPVVIYLAYVLVRHLADPAYASVLDALNLGIHELGHYVFRPFGEFLCAAGGTILQCLAPIVAVVMFHRQRDYFAIAFALAWLGTNLFDVALYVGDARARALPLVTPGGGAAEHDWSYLLGKMGILTWDRGIETVLRVAATGPMVAGLAFAGWLIWRMLRPTGAEIAPE